MRPWIGALAALAPVAAFAGDEKATLDDRFFKAFYQEAGLRDFEKAASLYAEVADAARAAKDPATEAKALLGRARCLKVSGKKDDAREAVKACLALEPGNAEAMGVLASLEGAPQVGSGDQELNDRCNTLLEWLAGQDTQNARREFALLGARGLPFLAKALRFRSLEHVEGAARLLATGAIPGGLETLEKAIADPEVIYSRVLCDAVLNAGDDIDSMRQATPADLPLLGAVARRPEAGLRRLVVYRLAAVDLGSEPRALDLLQALAGDPATEVRIAVIGSTWLPSYWKRISGVVVSALKSGVPAERAAAAQSIKQDPDLLRTAAGDLRALLKDPVAEVRQAAFATLNEVDGLAQADLAALLADADGGVVADAGHRLREVAPWEKGVGDAVLGAVKRALRAEVPSSGIESVIAFIDAEPRPGGLSVDDLVSLFVQSWSPEQRLGTRAASDVRRRILDAMANRMTGDEEGKRCVLRGLKEIASPDGVLQWMVRWTQEYSYRSVEIGIAAAVSGDPRIRATGYRCLANCGAAPNSGAVTSALRRLSEDLLGDDPDLQDAAMSVATVYPDPVSVEAIRRHHAAAQGVDRANLLWTLAKAAGKGAEPEVREDLASKDSSVRSCALYVLFQELGATDYAEIKGYLSAGGQVREVAPMWNGAKRPSLPLLRTFLDDIGPDRADDTVLRILPLLPSEERNRYLIGVLQHPNGHMRAMAATCVATWRAMDCVRALSALLDDPDAEVQAAAAKALEALNEYLQRKAAAARLLDGPEVDALDAAKALLRSPDASKRRGAILALAALQDRAAIPLLLKALDDADATVREAAIVVLEKLGGTGK